MRYLLSLLAVLLMVAGLNYATANVPTSPGVLTFTSAPSGGWTNQQHAKAVHYNGYTYFAWVDGDTGPIYVASYNHTTDAISTPIQIDDMDDPDTHHNPGLLVRDSDKKLLVAFSLHNGPDMFLRVSTNSLTSDPTMGGGFAAATNLDSSIGAADYTYPQLVQLTGIANDPIYLFYRDQSGSTGRLAYSKSSDGGATWSARTILATAASTNRLYWQVRASTTRVDILSTDRDAYGSEGVVDVGHMYLDGSDDKVYKSDGTEITAAKPFTHSELTQVETNATGAFVIDGIAGTNPVFTYAVDNNDGTVSLKYARWDGAAWDLATITTADHFPVDRFYGMGVINQADAEEVFVAKKTSSSTSELYSYTSADLGATWDAGTAVTSGSGDLNASPISVQDGVSSLPVIWLRGTLTSSFVFNFGIRALSR